MGSAARLALGVALVLAALPLLWAWLAADNDLLAWIVAALAFPGFHLIETEVAAMRDEPPVVVTVQKEWGA